MHAQIRRSTTVQLAGSRLVWNPGNRLYMLYDRSGVPGPTLRVQTQIVPYMIRPSDGPVKIRKYYTERLIGTIASKNINQKTTRTNKPGLLYIFACISSGESPKTCTPNPCLLIGALNMQFCPSDEYIIDFFLICMTHLLYITIFG